MQKNQQKKGTALSKSICVRGFFLEKRVKRKTIETS